jgi:hypothetical protein
VTFSLKTWYDDLVGNTPVSAASLNDLEARIAAGVSSGVGISDHGLLTGLADDDHTQYHNDVRGDARYYTQSQVDQLLAAINPSVTTTTFAAVIQESGGVYAARNTVTTSLTQMVIWKGPETNPPTIGGGYAVNGVDVFFAGT